MDTPSTDDLFNYTQQGTTVRFVTHHAALGVLAARGDKALDVIDGRLTG